MLSWSQHSLMACSRRSVKGFGNEWFRYKASQYIASAVVEWIGRLPKRLTDFRHMQVTLCFYISNHWPFSSRSDNGGRQYTQASRNEWKMRQREGKMRAVFVVVSSEKCEVHYASFIPVTSRITDSPEWPFQRTTKRKNTLAWTRFPRGCRKQSHIKHKDNDDQDQVGSTCDTTITNECGCK